MTLMIRYSKYKNVEQIELAKSCLMPISYLEIVVLVELFEKVGLELHVLVRCHY